MSHKDLFRHRYCYKCTLSALTIEFTHYINTYGFDYRLRTLVLLPFMRYVENKVHRIFDKFHRYCPKKHWIRDWRRLLGETLSSFECRWKCTEKEILSTFDKSIAWSKFFLFLPLSSTDYLGVYNCSYPGHSKLTGQLGKFVQYKINYLCLCRQGYYEPDISDSSTVHTQICQVVHVLATSGTVK